MRLAVQGMHKGVTAEMLAERLGVSYSYFLTAFRDARGVTFGHWYSAAKVRRAQRLLLQGSNIDEAAYATGYADSTGLRRAFKRVVGVAPSAWLSTTQRQTQ